MKKNKGFSARLPADREGSLDTSPYLMGTSRYVIRCEGGLRNYE